MRVNGLPFNLQRTTLIQLGRYIIIGLIVTAIDTSSFAFQIKHHGALVVAATLSYVLGVISHFTLNRLANFRNFDRSWQQQGRTYAAIVFCQYLLMLTFVSTGVAIGLPPLWAKLVAIAVLFPITFLAHRYLTFGAGIGAVGRRFLNRRGLFVSRTSDEKSAETL